MANLEEKYPALVAQYFKDNNTQQIIAKRIQDIVYVPDIQPVIQLEGSVSEVQRVKVISPEGMIEVRKKITKPNEFKVDYSAGFLYVHPSMCTKPIELDYYTIGGTYLSYERIFTKLDSNGNIIERLKDIIEGGEFAIRVIKDIADVVTYVERMEADIIESQGLIIEMDEMRINCKNDIENKVTDARERVDEMLADVEVMGGTSILINPTDWTYDNANKRYYYTWTHNQGTNNYSLDFSQFIEGVFYGAIYGFSKDNLDTVTIYSNTQDTVSVYLNSKAYAGEELDAQAIITDIISAVAQTGGTAKTLGLDDWSYDSVKELYYYKWTHGQGTNNYSIDFAQMVGTECHGAFFDYIKNDENNVTIYSPTREIIFIYVNSKAYTGDVGDPSLINIDRMNDGIEKVMMTATERQQLRNALTNITNLQQEDDNIYNRISTIDNTLLNKQNKIDNTLQTTNKEIVKAINELLGLVNKKQNIKDNSLETISKEVTGAINEVNAKGSSSSPFDVLYMGSHIDGDKGYTDIGNGYKMAWGSIILRIDGTDSEMEVTTPCTFTDTNFKVMASVGASNRLIVTGYPTATNKLKIYGWTTQTVGYSYKVNWIAVGK